MEDREIYERLARLEAMIEAGDKALAEKAQTSAKALELAEKQLADWYVTKEKMYVTLNRLTLAILTVALTVAGLVLVIIGMWNTFKFIQ
jgi:CHASE3 domain sensor protein